MPGKQDGGVFCTLSRGVRGGGGRVFFIYLYIYYILSIYLILERLFYYRDAKHFPGSLREGSVSVLFWNWQWFLYSFKVLWYIKATSRIIIFSSFLSYFCDIKIHFSHSLQRKIFQPHCNSVEDNSNVLMSVRSCSILPWRVVDKDGDNKSMCHYFIDLVHRIKIDIPQEQTQHTTLRNTWRWRIILWLFLAWLRRIIDCEDKAFSEEPLLSPWLWR